MENLRALRRHRSLSILDLAALTGISARQIAEIEYGLRRLSPDERDSLALVLGLRPHDLTGAHRRLGPQAAVARPQERQAIQALTAAVLAAAVATGSIGAVIEDLPRISAPRWGLAASAPAQTAPQPAPAASAPAQTAPQPAPAAGAPAQTAPQPAPAAGGSARLAPASAQDDAASVRQRALADLVRRASAQVEPLAPTLVLAPTPGEQVDPAPLPAIEAAPAFVLTEQGPVGCPVRPAAGRVVMTQGYGVGTHTPADIWGAVDLAVDGDGDGYAEAGSSWYVPIVATHDGQVTVSLDSDPAGNHVWVYEPGGIWRTGYAHLALVTVVSGQYVRAGEQIGMMGSTGKTTGPHLDYQVWRNGVNIDPTALVGCGLSDVRFGGETATR